MSTLRNRLALATCTLLAQGAHGQEGDWTVDSTYLSYEEADDRVSVDKLLIDLERTLVDGSVAINAVYDTMSGASPSGAIRGTDGSVTLTSASGGSGGEGYALSEFSDRRAQLGVDREQTIRPLLSLSYGAVVSSEDDFDSIGGTLGIERESSDRMRTYSAGVALTSDTIFRSSTGDTPVPLGDASVLEAFGEGSRNTYDGMLGVTRVVNRDTIAQLNLSISYSEGYHSDPYKIISAAGDDDRIVANFHDSRPDSRLRTSLYGTLKHNLRKYGYSLTLAWRLYRDDWGIGSATAELRYHHALTRRQSLEPLVRVYRQSAADFHVRKLDIDATRQPLLPADGLASADSRLDDMTSLTIGLKYGFDITEQLDVRIRAAVLDQRFESAEFERNRAAIVNTSLRYRF